MNMRHFRFESRKPSGISILLRNEDGGGKFPSWGGVPEGRGGNNAEEPRH